MEPSYVFIVSDNLIVPLYLAVYFYRRLLLYRARTLSLFLECTFRCLTPQIGANLAQRHVGNLGTKQQQLSTSLNIYDARQGGSN
jgi:hypothetical protein